MPSWLVPLICLVAFVGFIWFAFRQGTKVRSDRADNGGSDLPGMGSGDSSGGGSHHGF
jgi:cbb3-type cytochrome oxidase subunit 3